MAKLLHLVRFMTRPGKQQVQQEGSLPKSSPKQRNRRLWLINVRVRVVRVRVVRVQYSAAGTASAAAGQPAGDSDSDKKQFPFRTHSRTTRGAADS